MTRHLGSYCHKIIFTPIHPYIAPTSTFPQIILSPLNFKTKTSNIITPWFSLENFSMLTLLDKCRKKKSPCKTTRYVLPQAARASQLARYSSLTRSKLDSKLISTRDVSDLSRTTQYSTRKLVRSLNNQIFSSKYLFTIFFYLRIAFNTRHL